MNEYLEFDECVTTPKGRKALAKLKELAGLSVEADRIRRAVAEGLLPGVTPENAEQIRLQIDRQENELCCQIDQAEGYLP